MSQFNFKGIITALVTPFKNGDVDEASLHKLLEQQLENGIEGLVVNGTTGESPSLTPQEVKRIFTITKEKVGCKIPVIVGTGSNNTAHTLAFTQEVEKWGADAALVVVPYYNKPPQRGMVEHFTKIAKCCSIPQILYNVPGRTVVSLSDESIAELSKINNIIGVKEASGDPNRANKLRSMCRPNFVLLSGDDSSCVEFMLQGGDGVISVISHVIPKDLVQISKKARNHESAALEEYVKFSQLNSDLCLESNPIPVKEALHLMGLLQTDELRCPLAPMLPENTEKLRKTLLELQLLKGDL
ncbi:MAG: 4-hydroxy-tetrahydrodipicolinate synthase [Bdellovibrionales bacterium]|nr:4-hydroxy-tetrahydrodipicolinate synthase [Bdellovibrionales bacterium]